MDKITEYIDKADKGIISEEEALQRIKDRSIRTMAANILSGFGKNSPWRLFGIIVIAIFQFFSDAIDWLFEDQ